MLTFERMVEGMRELGIGRLVYKGTEIDLTLRPTPAPEVVQPEPRRGDEDGDHDPEEAAESAPTDRPAPPGFDGMKGVRGRIFADVGAR